MQLHPIHSGPLPVESLVIRLTLKDGAAWQFPASVVLENWVRYYSDVDHGWYEDAGDAMSRGGRDLEKEGQPEGEELRNLVECNTDWEHAACEVPWREAKPVATHVSGPATEPDDDLLWSVDEQGGKIECFCSLSPEEQYKTGFGWTDNLEATLANLKE